MPDALVPAFLERLTDELRSAPFRRLDEQFGAVRQRIDGLDLMAPFTGYPAVAQCRRELVALVRAAGSQIHGLATWWPNEAGVARYRPGPIGITPHRDGRWHRRLVVVATVFGSAEFTVCADRAGTVVAGWEAGPGSLTLLRGPGLAGQRDGRPLHAVAAPARGARCSLALRMARPAAARPPRVDWPQAP